MIFIIKNRKVLNLLLLNKTLYNLVSRKVVRILKTKKNNHIASSNLHKIN